MKNPLRVLIAEDSEVDAELILLELGRGGFAVVSERVESAHAMRAALERRQCDIVLSDYSMPAFDALGALAILQASYVDIPFIVVSGTIGEEHAVEVLKAGARDFFLKDRLSRLCSAVERELREAEARRMLRRAERERAEALQGLRRSERLFYDLFESSPDAT